MQVEQWMMEGNYRKVYGCANQAPHPAYAVFTDQLLDTVREDIAHCCERAYPHLTLADFAQLLGCSTQDAAALAERKGWPSLNGVFQLSGSLSKGPVAEADNVPADDVIKNALTYAKELERIV